MGLCRCGGSAQTPIPAWRRTGADADVLNDVLAFLPVLRHAVNPEKDTAVLGFEAGAEQVVRIEDQPGPVGNVTLQHVEDKFHVGVSFIGIPEDVGAQQQVGLEIGKDFRRTAFIQLEDGQIFFGLPKKWSLQ